MSEDSDFAFALKLQAEINDELSDNDLIPKSADTNSKPPEDNDYQMALKLQMELNKEQKYGNDTDPDNDDSDYSGKATNVIDLSCNKKTSKINDVPQNYLNQTQNLVHPEWELVDPTPDIFGMFSRFDQRFFQSRLGAVTVEWSKKMYSCAGICYQRGNRYVKEVIIRLSEPLLKLRPRKDLVETLLHEMIHAFCFVLNIREGNGGHGPNFKRIMEKINKVAGTNITVYHSFHDEVDAYKTHVWRCNGICQNHMPFQGWVRRTANRAPGPSDQWWAKHQRDCSGTFQKISEPTKPVKAAKQPTGKASSKSSGKQINESTTKDDIRNFFGKPKPKVTTVLPQVQPAAGLASAFPPSSYPGLSSAFPPTSYPGLSSDPFAVPQSFTRQKKPGNVVGMKDLPKNSDDEAEPKAKSTNDMQGGGYSLGSSDNTSVPPREVNRKHLRELWSRRFENTGPKTDNEPRIPNKRRRLSTDLQSWESYDDDVMVRNVVVPVVCISDSEDESAQAKPTRKIPFANSHERTLTIKREVMEDEALYSDDDIIMIDDEYDDNVEGVTDLTAAAELADQSVIDDLFGEDTLLQEFQRENDVVPSGSRYHHDTRNDITTCPICFEKMKRSEFANHLEGCSILIRVKPPCFRGKTNLPPSSNRINNPKPVKKTKRKLSKRESMLQSFGYTESEIGELDLSSSSEENDEADLTPRQQRQRGLFKKTIECPKCGDELRNSQLKLHALVCKRHF